MEECYVYTKATLLSGCFSRFLKFAQIVPNRAKRHHIYFKFLLLTLNKYLPARNVLNDPWKAVRVNNKDT